MQSQLNPQKTGNDILPPLKVQGRYQQNLITQQLTYFQNSSGLTQFQKLQHNQKKDNKNQIESINFGDNNIKNDLEHQKKQQQKQSENINTSQRNLIKQSKKKNTKQTRKKWNNQVSKTSKSYWLQQSKYKLNISQYVKITKNSFNKQLQKFLQLKQNQYMHQLINFNSQQELKEKNIQNWAKQLKSQYGTVYLFLRQLNLSSQQQELLNKQYNQGNDNQIQQNSKISFPQCNGISKLGYFIKQKALKYKIVLNYDRFQQSIKIINKYKNQLNVQQFIFFIRNQNQSSQHQIIKLKFDQPKVGKPVHNINQIIQRLRGERLFKRFSNMIINKNRYKNQAPKKFFSRTINFHLLDYQNDDFILKQKKQLETIIKISWQESQKYLKQFVKISKHFLEKYDQELETQKNNLNEYLKFCEQTKKQKEKEGYRFNTQEWAKKILSYYQNKMFYYDYVNNFIRQLKYNNDLIIFCYPFWQLMQAIQIISNCYRNDQQISYLKMINFQDFHQKCLYRGTFLVQNAISILKQLQMKQGPKFIYVSQNMSTSKNLKTAQIFSDYYNKKQNSIEKEYQVIIKIEISSQIIPIKYYSLVGRLIDFMQIFNGNNLVSFEEQVFIPVGQIFQFKDFQVDPQRKQGYILTLRLGTHYDYFDNILSNSKIQAEKDYIEELIKTRQQVSLEGYSFQEKIKPYQKFYQCFQLINLQKQQQKHVSKQIQKELSPQSINIKIYSRKKQITQIKNILNNQSLHDQYLRLFQKIDQQIKKIIISFEKQDDQEKPKELGAFKNFCCLCYKKQKKEYNQKFADYKSNLLNKRSQRSKKRQINELLQNIFLDFNRMKRQFFYYYQDFSGFQNNCVQKLEENIKKIQNVIVFDDLDPKSSRVLRFLKVYILSNNSFKKGLIQNKKKRQIQKKSRSQIIYQQPRNHQSNFDNKFKQIQKIIKEILQTNFKHNEESSMYILLLSKMVAQQRDKLANSNSHPGQIQNQSLSEWINHSQAQYNYLKQEIKASIKVFFTKDSFLTLDLYKTLLELQFCFGKFKLALIQSSKMAKIKAWQNTLPLSSTFIIVSKIFLMKGQYLNAQRAIEKAEQILISISEKEKEIDLHLFDNYLFVYNSIKFQLQILKCQILIKQKSKIQKAVQQYNKIDQMIKNKQIKQFKNHSFQARADLLKGHILYLKFSIKKQAQKKYQQLEKTQSTNLELSSTNLSQLNKTKLYKYQCNILKQDIQRFQKSFQSAIQIRYNQKKKENMQLLRYHIIYCGILFKSKSTNDLKIIQGKLNQCTNCLYSFIKKENNKENDLRFKIPWTYMYFYYCSQIQLWKQKFSKAYQNFQKCRRATEDTKLVDESIIDVMTVKIYYFIQIFYKLIDVSSKQQIIVLQNKITKQLTFLINQLKLIEKQLLLSGFIFDQLFENDNQKQNQRISEISREGLRYEMKQEMIKLKSQQNQKAILLNEGYKILKNCLLKIQEKKIENLFKTKLPSLISQQMVDPNHRVKNRHSQQMTINRLIQQAQSNTKSFKDYIQ